MAKENGQVEEADMMEDSEIEKKIEEQAKDSNKELGLPELDAEDGREDSEEDGEGGTSKASDPKAKKSNASAKAEGKEEDEEDMEEGELPPALKKAIDAKKGKDEDEDEDKKEEIEVNVDEDVAALVDGEELSEEFKSKAATIFEAAVKSKIAKIRKQIREESKKEQDERVESMQEDDREHGQIPQLCNKGMDDRK